MPPQSVRWQITCYQSVRRAGLGVGVGPPQYQISRKSSAWNVLSTFLHYIQSYGGTKRHSGCHTLIFKMSNADAKERVVPGQYLGPSCTRGDQAGRRLPACYLGYKIKPILFNIMLKNELCRDSTYALLALGDQAGRRLPHPD